MGGCMHCSTVLLVSDFLPALENVQGAGQTCSRDPLPHGLTLFAFAAGSDAQNSM